MLCLVSTGFLRLARLRLYSRPFLASLSADWATASALLSSLVKRKGTLGSLVRSLYGILSYTIRLYRDIKPQIPYKALKHFDWYISIIRACPNLDEMEVAADTEEELEQILQAIRSTKLVSVNFGRFGGLSGPLSTNDHLARKALQHPAFRNVEKISLHRLLVDLEDSTSIIPQAIKSVNLDDNYREHARAQQLMPVDCSNLVQFRLTTWVRYEHIVTYLTSLPSTIRNISLNIKDDREIKRFFDYTTRPSNDTGILRDALLSLPLPQLRSLIIFQFPTLSPRLLDTLFRNSPHIAYLDFFRSVWVLDIPHNNRVAWVEHCEAVFPLTEIIAILEKFKHLRRVHLGHVPATKEIVEGLEEAKKKVGFELEWESQPLPI